MSETYKGCRPATPRYRKQIDLITPIFSLVLLINFVFEPKPKMSRIGQVFNKVLQKDIPVFLTESGEGYKRLTGIIGEDVKQAALAKIKGPFESGDLFKDDDLKSMEQLSIT